jgi:hypothetical protein
MDVEPLTIEEYLEPVELQVDTQQELAEGIEAYRYFLIWL